MQLQELQSRFANKKYTLQYEKFKGNLPALILIPNKIDDLNFCLTQAKQIGFDLLKEHKISAFNAGINSILNGTQIEVKVYLLFNQIQEGREVNQESISPYFSTNKPCIEGILLKNYFDNTQGLFIETCLGGDSFFGSPSKFFEEFMGWVGVLVEPPQKHNSPSRESPSVKSFKGYLVSKEHSNFISSISYQELITQLQLPKVDWLHLKETDIRLLEILGELKNSEIKPRVITCTYISDDYTLIQLRDLLSPLGYSLDTIYFDTSFFSLR